MTRIVEFADEIPISRRGPVANMWLTLAEQLRASGRRAAKLDRKSTGVSKGERARALAAGVRIVVSTKHGTWIELIDPTAAEPGPPPIAPTTATAPRSSKPGPVTGTDVTVAEFVECYRRLHGTMPKVRAELDLTLGQFESLRAIARRDGLL